MDRDAPSQLNRATGLAHKILSARMTGLLADQTKPALSYTQRPAANTALVQRSRRRNRRALSDPDFLRLARADYQMHYPRNAYCPDSIG
jgi:hypothetical protein